MDELELLKKDWKRSDVSYNTYTEADIYPMIRKKSSSIVKTLFYISIAELVFWIAINALPYLYPNTFSEESHGPILQFLSDTLTVVPFIIIAIFIWLLFTSYRRISVIDSAKKLMENILKTRKVVKYYVIFNLFLAFVSVPLTFFLVLQEDPQLATTVNDLSASQMAILIAALALGTGIFILLFWVFYRLLYGILLKRLNHNYKELKRLED